LFKPFRLDQLIDVVKTVLEAGGAAPKVSPSVDDQKSKQNQEANSL
jgi:hypothetical protein